MTNKKKRVVVTGLGVITSIGIGKADFWKNLIAGKSGISRVEAFDTSSYDRHYGGEIKNFKAEQFIDKRKLKTMGRASQLALSAARLALEDAHLSGLALPKDRTGVCMGTTMGEVQILEEIDKVWTDKGDKHIDSKSVVLFPTNSIVDNISNELRLKQVSFLFANACAAGNYSIGYASDLIGSGRADVMLAGGSDAISRVNFVGFNRLFAMAPEKCQPFDKERKGMMVGEGAAVLILESLEHVRKRKARVYAEVLGYGLSCDAFHMTAPTVEGVTRCMTKAMSQANIKPDEVDYISAHGTGTPQNDKAEAQAIKQVFNGCAKKVPASSIKSMLGHTMGAASAIEAAVCCLAITESVVPPTINYETPDPECDIDCVPNKARKQKVNLALNNSYAFGGNNACLVLKKYC